MERLSAEVSAAKARVDVSWPKIEEATKARLRALYKQATAGDATESELDLANGGFRDLREGMRGVGRATAARQYVALARRCS